MPYTGINDSGLPNQVQRLPRHLREIWVAVFNENYDPEDEGKAFRIAWGAVRAADKEKQRMAWDWRRTLQHAAERMGLEPPPLSEGDAEVLDAAEKARKTEGGNAYGAGAFLYAPDPELPSGWKLRIEDKPGHVSVAQLGRAAAALGPGFRGQRVELSDDERRAAAKKLISLYRGQEVADADIPEYLWALAGMKAEDTAKAEDAATQKEAAKTEDAAEKEAEPANMDAGGIPVLAEEKAITPWRTALKIGADREQPGRVRWTAISSGGFEDRDREVVSTAFLQSCVQTADKLGHRGPVDLLHVDGFEVGACDYQAVIGGEPGLLLESGLFDDTEAGRRAAAYYSQNADDTGVSIKFHYVNRTPDGVYQPPGLIVKRSFMPRTWAAFPWSAITVKEIEEMAKGKALSAEKRAELERILGTDLVETILEQAEKDTDVLKSLGVRFKELADEGAEEQAGMKAEKKAKPAQEDEEPVEEEAAVVEATEAEAPPAAEEPMTEAATDEDEDEEEDKKKMKEITTSGAPMELLLSDEALAAVAEKAVAGIRAEIAPLAESLNTLQAAFRKIAADVEQIKRDEDERVAEKIRHLPRATVKAITTQPVERPSQRPVEDESDSNGGSLHQKAMKTLYGA